ncbi:MAG: hypothetical protein QOI53_4482, partial [Verrucomicrobiota bacterium]|nr:hypothetical protein [Verrucomicrobiota bacterium]
ASGVDSLNPEVTKVAFPGLPITIRPVFRLHGGVFGITKKLGSASPIAFGIVENSLAALSAGRRVRCSWHFVVRPSPDPQAQVVVLIFRPPTSPVASVPKAFGAGGERLPLSQ